MRDEVQAQDLSDVPRVQCPNHGTLPILTPYRRSIASVLDGSPKHVLDLGCGLGDDIRFLHSLGHIPCGCHVIQREQARRELLQPLLGPTYEHRIRRTVDEARILFESGMFDAIVANAVFEHVKLFAPMLAECARVLKPDGVMIASFPTLLMPLEPHIGRLPFAHWLPPGKLRRGYLRALWHVWPAMHREGMTARIAALQPGWQGRVKGILARLGGEELLSSVTTATIQLAEPRSAHDRPVPEYWERMTWATT